MTFSEKRGREERKIKENENSGMKERRGRKRINEDMLKLKKYQVISRNDLPPPTQHTDTQTHTFIT